MVALLRHVGGATHCSEVQMQAEPKMGAVEPNPNRITAEDWLRGYFGEVPEPGTKIAHQSVTKKWKNIDYLRLKDIGLHLLELTPGKRVLDIGCANGATMVYCGLQGAVVAGVDLDSIAVSDANALLARFSIEGAAVVGDATKLPFEDESFDAVITSDFVEHIYDDDKVLMLTEARRVLKKGGVLVAKTPNLAYLKASLAYRRLRAIAQFKNPMRFVIPHTPGTDDPQHIGLTTRWAFGRCLTKAGFLNHHFFYAPLRRFGESALVEVLSTEVPVLRDYLSEELVVKAYKPIALSHFPD